jgi:signal transduction histidine kinase
VALSRGLDHPASPAGASSRIYLRRHFRGNRRRHRWILTVSLVLLGCSFPSIGADESSVNHIRRALIIYEDGFSSLTIRLVDARLRSTLEGEKPSGLELYTEYLDTQLFSDEASREVIRQELIRKYRDRKLNLIVAVGPSPLRFMIQSHESFFKDVPVVFCGVFQRQIASLPAPAQFTGVWLTLEPVKSLDVALRLFPGTRHVTVVGGVGPFDEGLETAVKTGLGPYEQQLDISYLTDLPMPALLGRLRQLPSNTIVLYTTFQRDAAGTYFARNEPLEMIDAAANAPVFVMFDTHVTAGDVGGHVTSFGAQAEAAGRIALRILHGEKPQGIPPVTAANVDMFDWRQLRRWGVPRSRIPAGATILFREPTLWERAKYLVIFALVGLVAQTCLLFFLVWLVRRNGRAQQAAERRLALEEISHLNRVASMGRMAASLVHELSQPLAAILSNAQAADHFASRAVPDLPEIHAALADIAEDNKRARAVMNNMRAIFQKHSISRHEIDLNEVVSTVGRLVSHEAALREVELRFIFRPGPLPVMGDEIPLQQVVLNLITNGMDAMKEVPIDRRTLTVTTTIDGSKNCGAVTVEDNGPGITEKDGPKVFTPFFTTKSDGLGMGLSICQSIIESLGGRISFSNRPRAGALFQVQLLLAEPRNLSMTA